MTVDRSKLYNGSSDFFELNGSAIMKLSRSAALGVCQEAASKNAIIVRIEGGFKQGKAFEARLDCIWDGIDPPYTPEAAIKNNLRGAAYIERSSVEHNAFIVTIAPIAP